MQYKGAVPIIPDDELRKSLSESLNVFQATVTMCSIFLGFVFAGLLQLLAGAGPIDDSRRIVSRALVVAMLSLLGSLIGFHFVTNQVFRYWNVFMPRSKLALIASILFVVGISVMLFTVSELLFLNLDPIFGWLVRLVAIASLLGTILAGTFHGKGSNTRDVGQ